LHFFNCNDARLLPICAASAIKAQPINLRVDLPGVVGLRQHDGPEAVGARSWRFDDSDGAGE